MCRGQLGIGAGIVAGIKPGGRMHLEHDHVCSFRRRSLPIDHLHVLANAVGGWYVVVSEGVDGQWTCALFDAELLQLIVPSLGKRDATRTPHSAQ